MSSTNSVGRPRVVTAIGRLRILAGILTLGWGIAMVTSPAAYLNFMEESASDYSSEEELGFYSDFIGITGVVEGIIGIVIAIAILAGKKGAWMANVVFSGILVSSFALDVALGGSSGIIGVLLNGFIFAYMFTKPVRAYFGRIAPSVTPFTASAAAGQ